MKPERSLSTVLFTDIVGSTDHASELGDRRWRDVLDRHQAGDNPKSPHKTPGRAEKAPHREAGGAPPDCHEPRAAMRAGPDTSANESTRAAALETITGAGCCKRQVPVWR